MVRINDALEKDAENCECTLNSTIEVRANRNSGKYEYVKLLRNTFDRNLFPNNFDDWTVGQRYIWINKNLSKFYPNVPESLLELIPAFFCQEDCDRSPVEKPEWLDMTKYRKGQKFVQDYFISINVTAPLALISFYTFESINAIILNGDSRYTPCLAFKRNISTISRMMQWFTGEPWIKGTPAFKEMQVVRKMHVIIRNKLSRLNNHEIDKACKFENPWCPDRELLLKDFAEACPFEKIGQRPYKSFFDLPFKKHVSNAEIAIVQCCFVSFILLHPENFGVHNATDEDLEAFCHIWRCYGYYLGIEDEYNFCRGSLGEIKRRMQDLYQYWVIPNFKEVTPEWEHMTRCLVEPWKYSSMYMSYKMAILLLTDSLGINMPRIYASLSYTEWITHKIWKFVLRYAFKLSIIRSLVNQTMFGGVKKLMNFTPEEKEQMYMQFEKKIQNSSITF